MAACKFSVNSFQGVVLLLGLYPFVLVAQDAQRVQFYVYTGSDAAGRGQVCGVSLASQPYEHLAKIQMDDGELFRDFRTDGDSVMVQVSDSEAPLRLLLGRMPKPEWKVIGPLGFGEVIDWTCHFSSGRIFLLCKTTDGARVMEYKIDQRDAMEICALKGERLRGEKFLGRIALSPSTKRLVVWGLIKKDTAEGLVAQLYLIDLQNGQMRLPELLALPMNGDTYAGEARWSPDETRILVNCASVDSTGRKRIPGDCCMVDWETLRVQRFTKHYYVDWVGNDALLSAVSQSPGATRSLSVRKLDGEMLLDLGKADHVRVLPGSGMAVVWDATKMTLSTMDLSSGKRIQLPVDRNLRTELSHRHVFP